MVTLVFFGWASLIAGSACVASFLKSWNRCCWEVFQEPSGSFIFIKEHGLKIFFATFTTMSFILAASYSGILVSYLTLPSKITTMKTLKDVATSKLVPVQFFDFTDNADFYPGMEHRLDIISRYFCSLLAPP